MVDRKHGGVYTCLDRDGSLMDTTKSVWFQGRFGFIAAYAYNNIEKNPEWLAASKSCIDFIEAHCFDADGRMYFEVMEDGTPLRKRRRNTPLHRETILMPKKHWSCSSASCIS